MRNSEVRFHGQQENEVVLFSCGQHAVAMLPGAVKVVSIGIAFASVPFLINLGSSFRMLGFIVSVGLAILGLFLVRLMQSRYRVYVTDRRIARFEASTPFVTNMRSLSWEEIVKVKTFSRNLVLRAINVGSVVIHAKSTFIHMHEQSVETILTNDDIDLKNIQKYKELGNYIDEILYKHRPHVNGGQAAH